MSVLALRRSTILADARPLGSMRLRSSQASSALVRTGVDLAPSIASPATATTPQPTAAMLAEGSKSTFRLNWPNVLTMSGYAATIAWLMGGHWTLAVYGIFADELDGHVARKTGEETPYGSLLDWTVDVSLTALVLLKLGVPWALLVVTPIQVYLRETGWSPKFGSFRALFTGFAVVKG